MAWPLIIFAGLFLLGVKKANDEERDRLNEPVENEQPTAAMHPDSGRRWEIAAPPSDSRALVPTHQLMSLFAPGDGREVFTPYSLQKAREYRVEVNGVCAYRRGDQLRKGDGYYLTDYAGNFLKRTDWLQLCDADIAAESVEEDRASHRYVLSVKGTGKKLGVRINISPLAKPVAGEGLRITVAAVQERKIVEAVVTKSRALRPPPTFPLAPPAQPVSVRQRAVKPSIPEEFLQRIDSLVLQYQDVPPYEEPARLEQYARTFGRQLLARREEILRRHHEFHRDARFVKVFKQRAPQTYLRATFEVRALARAEQLAEERRRRRKEREPRRATLFAQEAREQIAVGRKKAEAMIAARRALEKYDDLDPDDRERLLGELIEAIMCEDGDDGRKTI